MRRIILILFLLSTSFLNAQEKTFNKKDFFSHQSVSVGGGISYGMELKSKGFIYNFATSFHFSNKFHTEIEYFYGKTKESEKEGHTLFLIPEISFNLYENKWKLYAGLGVAAATSRDFGLVFPTANMKLEYKINNRFSINTETVLLPIIQKINFNYYLPY